MDETTANSEMCLKSAWSKKGDRIKIPRSTIRYNCTIYAAVSNNCMLQPVYLIRKATTNNVDFREFLREVKSQVNPDVMVKPFLVFDGHSAHCTPQAVKDIE